MPTDFVKIEQKSNMATANYQADHAGSRRHRCHTEVRYENVLPGWCQGRHGEFEPGKGQYSTPSFFDQLFLIRAY